MVNIKIIYKKFIQYLLISIIIKIYIIIYTEERTNMNFNNIKQKLMQFMYGRYGSDNLNIFLLVLGLILSFTNYTWFLMYPLLFYAMFRSFSKNIYNRQKELQIYNRIIGYKLQKLIYNIKIKLKSLFYTANSRYKTYQKRREMMGDFIFFKCKKCKNTLKLPRNKGKLKVTCPVCKTETYRNT
jgi:ribosomal protein S27E